MLVRDSNDVVVRKTVEARESERARIMMYLEANNKTVTEPVEATLESDDDEGHEKKRARVDIMDGDDESEDSDDKDLVMIDGIKIRKKLDSSDSEDDSSDMDLKPEASRTVAGANDDQNDEDDDNDEEEEEGGVKTRRQPQKKAREGH